MINQLKEKDMKDLDQSDVNRDAERMLQEEMDAISENLDPADLYSVLAMIHDADDPAQDFGKFLNSPLARDLIKFTQSDPSNAYPTLIRMHDLDQAMSEL